MSGPLTEQGMILGTLNYMAPEQVEGKQSDARSDMFSFGAVLYEMVSGARAFEGESPANVMAAVLGARPAISVPAPAPRAGHARAAGSALSGQGS